MTGVTENMGPKRGEEPEEIISNEQYADQPTIWSSQRPSLRRQELERQARLVGVTHPDRMSDAQLIEAVREARHKARS